MSPAARLLRAHRLMERAAAEKDRAITDALAQAAGSQREAARLLGMPYPSLQTLMRARKRGGAGRIA